MKRWHVSFLYQTSTLAHSTFVTLYFFLNLAPHRRRWIYDGQHGISLFLLHRARWVVTEAMGWWVECHSNNKRWMCQKNCWFTVIFAGSMWYYLNVFVYLPHNVISVSQILNFYLLVCVGIIFRQQVLNVKLVGTCILPQVVQKDLNSYRWRHLQSA